MRDILMRWPNLIVHMVAMAVFGVLLFATNGGLLPVALSYLASSLLIMAWRADSYFEKYLSAKYGPHR